MPTLLLDKHPGKTFIGRIERGFGFLGYHFSREGLTVATKTVEQFVARATQRYAQEPGTPKGVAQLRDYVRRWIGWAAGGLTAPPLQERCGTVTAAFAKRPSPSFRAVRFQTA